MKKILIAIAILLIPTYGFAWSWSGGGGGSGNVTKSGTTTAGQVACWGTGDDPTTIVSCGAKTTYTEPAGNQTICRTGSGATGACTVPHKLAVFVWDGGGSALTAAAGTKRCAFVTETAVLTGLYFSTEAESTSDITVTVTKDAFAAGAHSTTAWNIISSSNVATIPSAGTVLNVNTTSFTATAITAGDQICATITATDTTKWLQLTLYGTY
jgi:hypothetical protein